VLYRTVVEKYERDDDSSRWVTIWEKEEMPRFVVVDGTGMVIVDPEPGALSLTGLEAQYDSDLVNVFPDHVGSFLDRSGIKERGPLGIVRRALRVRETVLPPATPLFVHGYSMQAANPRELKGIPGMLPMIVTRGPSDETFVISNTSESHTLTVLRAKARRSKMTAIGFGLLPAIPLAAFGLVHLLFL